MARVRVRGKFWHIQWYDRELKKSQGRTLKMLCTPENEAKAKAIADKLQKELDRKNAERKGFRIRALTIGESFKHLYEVNIDAHKKTILDIRRFEKKFLEFFSEKDPVSKIKKQSAERFLIEIKKLNLKQNTIHGYGKRFSHYLNFLFEYEYILYFKINKSIRTKPELVPKITFRVEHFQRIFFNLYRKSNNFITAVLVLAYTGLRSSDILSIRCENIDLENRVIRFFSPKRKRHREIGFHKDLVPILKGRMEIVGSGPLIGYKSVENLGRAVTQYFKQIGIDGNSYVTRTFRKSFITYCRNTLRMDASIVESLVGHEHGTVADRHYNEITPEVMKDELLKYDLPLVRWMNDNNPNYKEEL
ncbi:MAG: tyrosine-type recombinase/integrase [Melioribacteraceae bacterium]|nr:tyrosine-type recombinase/integrase [Melioribacteraceae bacterium]